MSVGTKILWEDREPTQNEETGAGTGPLFLTCFSSSKGPEDMRIVDRTNFSKLYGYGSFDKYGQPFLQARRIVENGGRLLAKRLVATDTTYANAILRVAITEKSTIKTTSDGKKIYLDADGKEYIEGDPLLTEEAITDGTYKLYELKTASLKYFIASMEDLDDYADLEKLMEEPTDTANVEDSEESITGYNLFAIADVGKGNTGKRFKINMKTAISKQKSQTFYTISDIENVKGIPKEIDVGNFTLDPKYTYNGRNYGLDTSTVDQFHCIFSYDGYSAFVEKLVEITGYTAEYIEAQDLLFGRTCRSLPLDGIELAEDSEDLGYEYGIELSNGKDGSNFEVGSEAWNKAALDFFEGKTDDEMIYNTDVYKIDAVADANFDISIKNAIVSLAEWRKDLFYFRDMGLDLYDYESIEAYQYSLPSSKFCASYCTAYKVKEPDTSKPVKVTMIYSLVDAIIEHFNNGRHLPFAGYTITDAIDRTVNFLPKQTPNVDQKELLDQNRINYLTYTTDMAELLLETMNTSTGLDGQLNYIQNVLAVQEVIKDIREYCPVGRYSFTQAPTFDEYARKITENVLEKHMGKFDSLVFEYVDEDEELVDGNFDGSLRFSFNPHIQSETFRIYAND